MNWKRQGALSIGALLLASPLAAPVLLAFPYASRVGSHKIYSETPIDKRTQARVEAADALAKRSPIAMARLDQPIFLTRGGWRWTYLSAGKSSAFGLSRPITEAIIINRTEAGSGLVRNGLGLGGVRRVDGVLAHEMTHGAIRAHFGLFADARYPAWLREGYCDHVAGGGSLSDSDAALAERTDPGHPALIYYRGRKRIEAQLARNGGSVDALFASAS